MPASSFSWREVSHNCQALANSELSFIKASFCYLCLVEKGDSDDSESYEHIKKRAKRGQQSPKSKRATRTAATKKDASKNRAKPSLHVTVDSTTSTSPTDDQVRKLTVLGKALKERTVRDPEDDERILVSGLQSRLSVYCSKRPPAVGVEVRSCAPVVVVVQGLGADRLWPGRLPSSADAFCVALYPSTTVVYSMYVT